MRVAALVFVIAVSVWLCASGVHELVLAAQGGDGDTGPSVPLTFGLIFLAIGAASGYGAWKLRRRRRPE